MNPSVSDMKEKLLSDECYEHPFKWDPRKTMKIIPSAEEILNRVADQLSTIAVDADLQFEYLMCYIGQSFAYASMDKLQEALDSLQRGEEKLNEFTDNSPNDTMYGQAFLHLMLSMRAYLLTLVGDVETASKVLPQIPAVSGMDLENQAALNGLRGVFYGDYGFEGFKLAIEFLSKACEMNASESSWHFLKGKYLSRLRHVEHPQGLPNADEMHHLEQATKLKRNGTYSLFLAQMYHEMAKCYFTQLRKTAGLSSDQFQKEKKRSTELNEKSHKLYKESLELKPDCPQMLFRCAKGFMRLPFPFRQEELAKKLLEKGLALIPDSGFGNHTMAQYCERVEKDPQKAMKHLKICEEQKIFPAVMDLVRLEYQVGGATDTVPRLAALLDSFNEVVQKSQILVLLSSHHLFSLNDLRKACEYAKEVERLNGSYDYLKKLHQPFLTRGVAQHFSQMINLLEVLMDEMQIAVQEPTCSPENKAYFEAFFEELSPSSEKSASITQEPRYLKRKIIADGEKPFTPSTSRANVRRKENSSGSSSGRDRGSKFRFENKFAPSSSSRAAPCKQNNSRRSTSVKNSNPKIGEGTSSGGQEDRDSVVEEVVESVRKMKTRDSSSNKDAHGAQQDPFMMAILDKYRD